MRKLLVLDLDETLIFATREKLEAEADDFIGDYFIYKRPGLDDFLIEASRHFHVGIWSSASDAYVTEIVEKLLSPIIELAFVWSRSKCSIRKSDVFDEYIYEKRLDKLKKRGYALEHILIVDDTPEKSRTNFGNMIKIEPFTGNSADKELSYLVEYLETLREADNVRTIEKRHWRKSIRT